MASRFGSSSLHQRDARSSLFDNYTGDKPRPSSQSPARFAGTYGYNAGASGSASVNGGFRPATPNRKGQYSDAVLSELESQNDDQVEGMSAKVKMLKDLTVAIGDEIRDSSKLADSMNDSFENTRETMENFEASNSTNNDPSMGADQESDSMPTGNSLGHESSMGSDQPSQPIPNGVSRLPDPFAGLSYGPDSVMGFDPSFLDLDGNINYFPLASPVIDPQPAFWDTSFENIPPFFITLIKPAASEQEITTLHAQLPEASHRLAQNVDEGLHNILTLLNSTLTTLDKNPITYTGGNFTNISDENQSCVDLMGPLMQACKGLQDDGLALCIVDKGGYGVLCATFKQVAYRFDMYELVGEMWVEDWFDVFVGMRERIMRMGKDSLYQFARGEGKRLLAGWSATSPKETKAKVEV
ncbi:protein transport protein bet1 [Trapelia coarctata]|nr:protein transport protein bet1 [Trapelia coarctata]